MPDDVDGPAGRVEDNARLAALELAQHMPDFLLQRDFPLPIVRPLSQHERFDHALQRSLGQLAVRDDHWFGRLLIHGVRDSQRQTAEPQWVWGWGPRSFGQLPDRLRDDAAADRQFHPMLAPIVEQHDDLVVAFVAVDH